MAKLLTTTVRDRRVLFNVRSNLAMITCFICCHYVKNRIPSTVSHIQTCAFLGAVLSCFTLAGCKHSGELETAPTSGLVRLDGKPLATGTVTFIPQRGLAATGTIGADGTFVLSTYSSGDGAIVGKNKVAVWVIRSDSNTSAGPEQKGSIMAIPPHYATAEGSGLEFEVMSGQSNNFTLDLNSK